MLAMTDDRKEITRNALAQAAAAEGKALRRLMEIGDAARRWHLVQINQQSFRLASEQLEWAGYRLYAPMLREMLVPAARKLSLSQRKNRHLFGREKLTPYFGSYRFVRFNVAIDPWHDLFKLVGVHGIGCKGNVPVAMPNELIEELQMLEQNGAIPATTPVKALFYKVGEEVRVNTGPFSGFTGKVETIDERGRIGLLLDLFARLTPVDLTADDIEKFSRK